MLGHKVRRSRADVMQRMDLRQIGLRDDLHVRDQHRLRRGLESTSLAKHFLLRSFGMTHLNGLQGKKIKRPKMAISSFKKGQFVKSEKGQIKARFSKNILNK